jgi:glycosyltransferase involved in cell wall biosynthesis
MFSKIYMLGWRDPSLPEKELIGESAEIRRSVTRRPVSPVGKLRVLGRIVGAWRDFYKTALPLKPGLLHCHSVNTLPIGVALMKRFNAPLIYDAHELETDCGQNGRQRVIDKMIERLCIRRASGVLVVSESISDWYALKYGIGPPVVVRNIPMDSPYISSPGQNYWRELFRLPPNALIFIYQGSFARGRRIEQLIRVFSRSSPNRHLIFMGFGALLGEIQHAASLYKNIHYAPAVTSDKILERTAAADVGINGVENICKSYYLSLPNKVFEYLLAGLPVLSGDLPEVKRIVDAGNCGWIVEREDDSAWVNAVNSLTADEIARRKCAAMLFARSLSWESEAKKMLTLYRSALGESVSYS